MCTLCTWELATKLLCLNREICKPPSAVLINWYQTKQFNFCKHLLKSQKMCECVCVRVSASSRIPIETHNRPGAWRRTLGASTFRINIYLAGYAIPFANNRTNNYIWWQQETCLMPQDALRGICMRSREHKEQLWAPARVDYQGAVEMRKILEEQLNERESMRQLDTDLCLHHAHSKRRGSHDRLSQPKSFLSTPSEDGLHDAHLIDF